MEFSRPEYWRGLPFPSSEDLPNPGIESRSPSLQVDSLPAEKRPNLGGFFLFQFAGRKMGGSWRGWEWQLLFKGYLLTSLTLGPLHLHGVESFWFCFVLFLIFIYFIWLNPILAVACGSHRLLAAACGLLSSCGTWAPEGESSVIVACGLSCPDACGILVPWLWIKSISPSLEGRLVTAGPPGKSPWYQEFWGEKESKNSQHSSNMFLSLPKALPLLLLFIYL